MIRAVTLRQETKSQELTTERYAYECQLNGAGDIDGDGQSDYVMTLVGDSESQTILYLSSASRRGELVGQAAIAWFSCCC